jgi:hypothetical protein
MNVQIVTPGRYINARLKAVNCQAGDQLETKDWYGHELVLHGQAVAVTAAVSVETVEPEAEEQPAADEQPIEEKPAETKPETKKEKPRKRVNPFVGS